MWEANLPYEGRLMVHRARVIVTNETFVLLVQERDHSWNLPGGEVEEDDWVCTSQLQPRGDAFKALEVCACREVWEETGLCVTGPLTRFAMLEGQAVYKWNAEGLSWHDIRTTWWGPHNEIRRIWWGPIESAVSEPYITTIGGMALAMMMTANAS